VVEAHDCAFFGRITDGNRKVSLQPDRMWESQTEKMR